MEGIEKIQSATNCFTAGGESLVLLVSSLPVNQFFDATNSKESTSS
jgi:hypothetical protein